MRKYPDLLNSLDAPAAHDVAFSCKDLGEATDCDVRKRKNMNVDKISDSLINHNGEIIAVCKRSYASEIRRFQQGISREFAEKSKETLAALTTPLKIVQFI